MEVSVCDEKMFVARGPIPVHNHSLTLGRSRITGMSDRGWVMNWSPMKNDGIKPRIVCSVDLEEPLPELLVTSRTVVYPWQCDHMGHMNVMWYTGKFDEATWHLMGQIGITPSYLRNHRRGMAAVQQETTYRRELFAGDLIMIQSGILEMREKVIRFHHEMVSVETRDVAAVTMLTGVHLNSETRKSCPFPAEILERGRRLMVKDSKGVS